MQIFLLFCICSWYLDLVHCKPGLLSQIMKKCIKVDTLYLHGTEAFFTEQIKMQIPSLEFRAVVQ